MNGGLVGMDIDEVRSFAKRLDAASESLLARSAAITGMLSQTGWHGHDGESFRRHWETALRPSLARAARQMKEASRTAQHNAAEQEQASTAGPGMAGAAPVQDVLGKAADLWEDLWGGLGSPEADGGDGGDGNTDGNGDDDGGDDGDGDDGGILDSAQETFSDAVEWGEERIDTGVENVRDAVSDQADTLSHGFDLLGGVFHGDVPSVTEVVATSILYGGHAANTLGVIGSFGQWDPIFSTTAPPPPVNPSKSQYRRRVPRPRRWTDTNRHGCHPRWKPSRTTPARDMPTRAPSASPRSRRTVPPPIS